MSKALQSIRNPGVVTEIEELRRQIAHYGSRSVRVAFLVRALRAVEALAGDLGTAALGEAVSAPSDLEALLRALREESVASQSQDPLAAARLRGLEARRRLLESEGGTLPATAVAKLLGISRQAVNKRRRAGTLLAFPLGRRGFAYPLWQFEDGAAVAGLEEVLRELSGEDPWMQARFFLHHHPHLDGERPLDALRHGRREEVVTAARSYGEHGAH